jgi:hypothetical protein
MTGSSSQLLPVDDMFPPKGTSMSSLFYHVVMSFVIPFGVLAAKLPVAPQLQIVEEPQMNTYTALAPSPVWSGGLSVPVGAPAGEWPRAADAAIPSPVPDFAPPCEPVWQLSASCDPARASTPSGATSAGCACPETWHRSRPGFGPDAAAAFVDLVMAFP